MSTTLFFFFFLLKLVWRHTLHSSLDPEIEQMLTAPTIPRTRRSLPGFVTRSMRGEEWRKHQHVYCLSNTHPPPPPSPPATTAGVRVPVLVGAWIWGTWDGVGIGGSRRGGGGELFSVDCLTSQKHATVSQGRICEDNSTCCHTEIQAADPTFHLTQSQRTDTGQTSPTADPITPGAWQGSHWSASFEVTGMTSPGKKNPHAASGNRIPDLPLSRWTP